MNLFYFFPFLLHYKDFIGERNVLLNYEIHENTDKYSNVKNCTYRNEIKFQFPGLIPEHLHRSIGSKGSDQGKKK